MGPGLHIQIYVRFGCECPASLCIFVLSICSAVGPTDCIVEGEVLKLGGPFLQAWQKKYLKLYPNRLEFYNKNRDGQMAKGKGVEVGVVELRFTSTVIMIIIKK